MICLFLILSIGISHGALDNQKGGRLLNFYLLFQNGKQPQLRIQPKREKASKLL